MGILNVTTDSFYDGAKYLDEEKAIQHAMQLINEGADIIDIGAESTRPGAEAISPEIEIERVEKIIKKLSKTIKTTSKECPSNPKISIDTYKSEVARKAIEAGADMINDIYALRFDNTMINVLKDFPETKIVLMHLQGTPENMQINPCYKNVINEIIDFFKERIDFCLSKGVSEKRIIIDPGIGFGKTFEHNQKIFRNIELFHCFKLPILLGASRKSFINQIYESKPQERLIGSLASSVVAFMRNIDIIRVHDVKEHKQLIESLSWMF